MYASGDGIEKDQKKAFELFSEVANAYADENPRAASAPFVADASWPSARTIVKAYRTVT